MERYEKRKLEKQTKKPKEIAFEKIAGEHFKCLKTMKTVQQQFKIESGKYKQRNELNNETMKESKEKPTSVTTENPEETAEKQANGRRMKQC